MSDLPAGVDPDLFEDLHFSLAGVGLCLVIGRPSEVWEMLQVVRAERKMIRGEVYRYTGLRDSYRAGGIARTIVAKLDQVRHKTGDVVGKLRPFLQEVPDIPHDAETLELVIAFITLSQKGRDAAARWVAAPGESHADASEKVRAILGMVESYRKALREFRPAPPPPSSPIDQWERPQLTPRFERVEAAAGGSLIPSAPPAAAAEATPRALFQVEPVTPPALPKAAPPAAAPAAAPAKVETAAPPELPKVDAPLPAAPPMSPASVVLPRGVNPEILEDIRRVDQCRRIFEETGQSIEVWEVFCLVMLDSENTRKSMDELTALKKAGAQEKFTEGTLLLFERLLNVRAQYAKFVRDLRGFIGALPIGHFGKDTTEMALGFIVASGRGRERAQTWLTEPGRYKAEACGRLEDIVSRTMNYQTALRMVQPA